jgi:predicted nuclease with TOPRIM domain
MAEQKAPSRVDVYYGQINSDIASLDKENDGESSFLLGRYQGETTEVCGEDEAQSLSDKYRDIQDRLDKMVGELTQKEDVPTELVARIQRLKTKTQNRIDKLDAPDEKDNKCNRP